MIRRMGDAERYREQPDGRLVAGPDLSAEPGQTGFAPPLWVGALFALLLVAAGFGGYYLAGGEPPFAERYAEARIAAALECDGNPARSQVALVVLGKPLSAADLSLLMHRLGELGFRGVKVENVTYEGRHYYYAEGCR